MKTPLELVADRIEAKAAWIKLEGRSSMTYDVTFMISATRDAVVAELRKRGYQVNYLHITRNLSIQW